MSRLLRVSLTAALLMGIATAGVSARTFGGSGGAKAGYITAKFSNDPADATKCRIAVAWGRLKYPQDVSFTSRDAAQSLTTVSTASGTDSAETNKMYVAGLQVTLVTGLFLPILDENDNPAKVTVNNSCK